MSGASEPLAWDVAERIAAAWEQAVRAAEQGDIAAATASLTATENWLGHLLAPGGPLGGHLDGGRALVEELLKGAQAAAQRCEAAVSRVDESLNQLESQRQAVMSSRVAVGRIDTRPQWLDLKR